MLCRRLLANRFFQAVQLDWSNLVDVDVASLLDPTALRDEAENRLEIIGHCGFSVAPVLPGKTQLLADYLSGGAPWLPFREMSFPEYLDMFPAVAVNAGMLVGHNTLRLMVMGLEDRSPTEAELSHMIALLEDGLRVGAL